MTINEALEELKQAMWIGEDGDAAVNAPNKRAALKAFKELELDDVGHYEASRIKPSDVGIGFVGLYTEEHAREEGYDDLKSFCEAESAWYVSWADGVTGPKVYVLEN